MKTLLTILFFADALMLILLTFVLLKSLDGGLGIFKLLGLLLVYGGCILSLGVLLIRYVELPAEKKYHSFFD